MKLLSIVTLCVTLVSVVTVKDEKTCPEDLRMAAENVIDVCRPLFKCVEKMSNNKYSIVKDQESTGLTKEEIAQLKEDCLEKLEGEEAFQGILQQCSETDNVLLLCALEEFREECPDYDLPIEKTITYSYKIGFFEFGFRTQISSL